jgi:MFS family permease
MGIATFLIGCLPTFAGIGWWAALLLLILRLFQGFALGGEWSGAALVATENAPKGKRAWYGTFPQLGAPIGFIIANALFLVINFALPHPDGPTQRSEAFLAWGWRVPFLFSAVMVIIGLWVRLKLVESETFTTAEKKGAIRRFPGEVVRGHWKNLILGTFIMLATYVLFYLMTSFTLAYGTKATDAPVAGLGFGYTDFVIMQIIGVVFFGIFTLLSGPIADAVGRRKLLIWVTALIGVLGLTFNVFLLPAVDPKFTGALVQAFLVFGFMLMGATFGPMGAVLPELFPTNVRYTARRSPTTSRRSWAPPSHRRSLWDSGPPPAASLARGRLPVGLRRAHPHRTDPLPRDQGRRLRDEHRPRRDRLALTSAQSRNSARSRFVVKTRPIAIITA